MLASLRSTARRLWDGCRQRLRQIQQESASPVPVPERTPRHQPLQRLVLTDDVSRTLFEEYAMHREGKRGEEETGWVLMGHRLENEAIVLATLPAGAEREAGVAHVRFNSEAQALASRILRQQDRQLGILGVVHTHPGSLRHPSQGDFQGDREWVKLLRGREGVFGIGTADGDDDNGSVPVASQPKEHTQCYLGLRFTWYALADGDRAYRTLPIHLTIGPDMARPLHEVWPTLELHAARLDRLCRTLTRVQFEVVENGKNQALHVIIPLEANDCLRVILREEEVEYCLVRDEEWLVSSTREPRVDRGVYLMLAQLTEA